MTTRKMSSCLLLSVVLISANAGVAQDEPPAKGGVDDSQLLVGDWHGESICVVRPSACNDEKSLGHVRKCGDTPNRYSLQFDKIVDGKAIDIGTVDCTYAPAQHVLTCSVPKFVLNFTVQGKKMSGTMKLPDGTLWRNISLARD